MSKTAILALADGQVFQGAALGACGQAVGEVVFNTAMTGYQEILTDPSYAQQIVTLTYPHIGNTGINPEDAESSTNWLAGLVIRENALLPSHYRQSQSLSQYLTERRIVGIADIDTRALTHHLRQQGVQPGCIVSGSDIDTDQAIAQAQAFAGLSKLNLVQQVTTKAPYVWDQGSWLWGQQSYAQGRVSARFHVVVYDYGVKHSILRLLVDRGCRVTVVPADHCASAVLALKPDGVLLSNGPGDPQTCTDAIAAITALLVSGVPLFGICLGHQLLALACGARTIKMKFGHHGANHPVRDLHSGRVMISSQNHGFAVDDHTLPECLQVTHRSLFDQSVQGIRHRYQLAFGFQGHPEASPGPQECAVLFDQFIEDMSRHHAKAS